MAISWQVIDTTHLFACSRVAEVKALLACMSHKTFVLAVALIQREIVLGAYYGVLMFELELDVPAIILLPRKRDTDEAALSV